MRGWNNKTEHGGVSFGCTPPTPSEWGGVGVSCGSQIKLINKFSIALFTNNLLGSVRRIGGYNLFLAFSTSPLIQFSRISQIHSFFVSLVWMFGRNWDSVLNIEYELLFDDFKWLFSYFALDNSGEYLVDIFGSGFIAHSSLIILHNWQGSIVNSNIHIFAFSVVPFPSFCFYFFFGHWKILVGDCFVITKWW